MMAHTVTVYQVAHSSDPAGTDCFFPNLADARAAAKELVDEFKGDPENVMGPTPLRITLTGEGVCGALCSYPWR